MEVKIQSIHFDIAERLENHINKKAERLARHHSAISRLDVTLKVVKPESALNKEATIKAVIPQDEIIATKIADTFEEAVDNCLDAIEKQLEKTKNKK